MDKDSQAKLGRTKCDFCDQPATHARGSTVVCAAHADKELEWATAGLKQGSVREVPVKSMGLVTEDLHS